MMCMSTAYTNFTEITGNVIQTGVSGLQWLSQNMARGAFHDSMDQYDAPKCHPDTRKTLLGDINAWIKITDKETGIMFLHCTIRLPRPIFKRSFRC
ncbi:hypothetical protein BDQ17DRAFT_1357270 [Cyathus striatus]|nr:hypothetical protein BDQ17DRAFT_1357270 [Cyathus striatus]